MMSEVVIKDTRRIAINFLDKIIYNDFTIGECRQMILD